MALETVQAVRNAELKASQMEKDALQQKEAIILKAEQEREQIISSMTKDALEKSVKDLEEANRQAKVRLEKAVMQAENEIILLKEMVKNKEQSAIKLVLEEVI
jgi:V/A-type H+-transporting ATPase subunit G/H